MPLGEGHADFAAAFKDETGRDTTLTETAFIKATSPETFITRRDRTGGPAPGALRDAQKIYRRKSDDLQKLNQRRIKRIADADLARNAAFQSLIET